jgi:hypothetical protein
MARLSSRDERLSRAWRTHEKSYDGYRYSTDRISSAALFDVRAVTARRGY